MIWMLQQVDLETTSINYFYNRMQKKPIVGKLKLKSHFQDRISRNIEKQQQKEERQQEQRQFKQLFKDRVQVPATTITFEPTPGKGTITTSGKSIHGLQTTFSKDLQKGDLIIITDPELKTKQQRSICLILSNKSILLNQPFMQDQTQFGAYEVRKKPIVKEAEDLETEYTKKLSQIQRTKKIQKQKEKKTYEIREKKGTWSYTTKKYEVDKDMTKEELLNMREKVSRDKHCW